MARTRSSPTDWWLTPGFQVGLGAQRSQSCYAMLLQRIPQHLHLGETNATDYAHHFAQDRLNYRAHQYPQRVIRSLNNNHLALHQQIAHHRHLAKILASRNPDDSGSLLE